MRGDRGAGQQCVNQSTCWRSSTQAGCNVLNRQRDEDCVKRFRPSPNWRSSSRRKPDEAPETPEQRARRAIDANLEAAGWLVHYLYELDLSAGRGIAVREFP